MRKLKVNSYRQYKIIKAVLNTIITAFLIIFIIVFFAFLHEKIVNKDYTKFIYAFFAANAIITNILFAFGRSPIFMTRYNEKEQKLIYRSATMFLCAAMISFFVCGYVYVNTNSDFVSDFHSIYIVKQIISISFTVGVGFVVLLSVSGFIFFYLWLRKSMDKVNDEFEKKKA